MSRLGPSDGGSGTVSSSPSRSESARNAGNTGSLGKTGERPDILAKAKGQAHTKYLEIIEGALDTIDNTFENSKSSDVLMSAAEATAGNEGHFYSSLSAIEQLNEVSFSSLEHTRSASTSVVLLPPLLAQANSSPQLRN